MLLYFMLLCAARCRFVFILFQLIQSTQVVSKRQGKRLMFGLQTQTRPFSIRTAQGLFSPTTQTAGLFVFEKK